jgi:peptide/nickel transport system substrate-binding protein
LLSTLRSRSRGLLRSRLARPGAAVAVAVVAVTTIAACGSSSGSSASGSGTSASGATGTVNWEWELPTSWDPVTSSAGWDVHVLGLAYASVTTLNAAGDAGPGLASAWKYATDGKSVTFTLRAGLKFSDGSALTATSVAENIKRGQSQANSTVASELSVISKVVVNSPASFTLDLAQVDYQLPDLLGGKDGMIVNPAYFSAGKVTSLATKPEGAGPFTLSSYVPDSHANLTHNPSYWNASQIHVASLNVLDITQPEQILSSLESGQVNVAYIAGNQVAAAKSAGFSIDVIPSEVVDELDIQTTTAPFNNPKVVEALNYAINRQALVTVQESGYATPAYQPFPKGFVGYSPKLANEYPYNPAKAKQLLAQAGDSSGLSITLTSSGAADDPIAEQVQSQLAAVGVKVTIKDIAADTSTQYLYLDKTIPLAVDGTAGRTSPVEMLDVLYSQQGLMNVDGKATTTPAAVTTALNNALTVPLDSAAYASTLQNAVATSVEQDPIHIWLFSLPRIFAYSSTVSGIPSDLVQQRWEGVSVSGS